MLDTRLRPSVEGTRASGVVFPSDPGAPLDQSRISSGGVPGGEGKSDKAKGKKHKPHSKPFRFQPVICLRPFTFRFLPFAFCLLPFAFALFPFPFSFPYGG